MNTMNSYIQSRRDHRPVVSLLTNKKAPERKCSEAMTKLKNHSDATGMGFLLIEHTWNILCDSSGTDVVMLVKRYIFVIM